MNLKDYLKLTGQDPDFDPKEAENMRKRLVESERALRQQAETKEAMHAIVERLRRTMREHGCTTEEQAIHIMANEDRLDAAIRLYQEQLDAFKAAREAEEAKRIGASPWLASSSATTAGRVETKAAPWAVKLDEGTARISGLASPFGGSPDAVGDVVELGAYKATLAEAQARGRKYLWPLLWQHEPKQPIGGIVYAREDRNGLHIEAQIATDTELGRYAFSLLSKGMVQGLSIGFIARKVRYVGQTRHLLDIDLLEVSAVTFPAAPAAQVSSTTGN